MSAMGEDSRRRACTQSLRLINGLRLYYEVHGELGASSVAESVPLMLIPGVSTASHLAPLVAGGCPWGGPV
jgi:hypothetical protein